ncbi:MAG: hypothetical protein AABW72_05835 [archaeon]
MFGLGKGSIDILVDKRVFSQGESIQGKLVLKLHQPTPAKELRIALIGERKQSRFDGKTHHTEIIHVYDFKLPLDGEKTYSNAEYSFELKAPVLSGTQSVAVDGAVGAVLDMLNNLSTSGPINWHLDAALDIQGSFDVNKKVAINIG